MLTVLLDSGETSVRRPDTFHARGPPATQAPVHGNILSIPFQHHMLQIDPKHHSLQDTYRKVPKVMTPVTFGFRSPWGSLFSGGRYFRGVVTFGAQNLLE